MYWITVSLFVISCAKGVSGSNCLTDPVETNLPCDCCKSGFGGFNCTESCTRCKSRLTQGGRCHKSCEDGYFGVLCNNKCSQNCAKGNAGDIVCRQKDGECFNGCVPGYFGFQCDLMCKSKCHNNECLQKDGSCNRCKQNLYYGMHCSLNCSKGCQNGTCEMGGTCTDGCEDGYYGGKCRLPCGTNCINHRCISNTLGGFSCVDGCTDGYTSISCSDRCPENCVKCHQNTSRCMSCQVQHILKCDHGDCNNSLVTCQRQAERQVSHGIPVWTAGFITIGILILVATVIIVIKKRISPSGRRRRTDDTEMPLLSTQRTEEAGSCCEDGNSIADPWTLSNEHEEASHQRLINEIHDRTMSLIEARTKGIIDTSSAVDIVKKIYNGLTWITLTGRPGEGKSTFAYSVLKELQSRGRNVFQVISTDEFLLITRTYKRPIILLNKIFSDIVKGQAECGNWKKVLGMYWEKKKHEADEQEFDRSSGTTVVLVEHDYFLSSAFYYHGHLAEFITKRTHVFDMSKKLQLLDKMNICTAIVNEHGIELPQHTIRTLCQERVSAYQILRLFTILHKNIPNLPIDHFINSPQELFQEEIGKMMTDKLTTNLFKEIVRLDGKVSGDDLEKMKQGSDILKTGNNLIDKYLMKENNYFTFLNLSVYNIVEYVICKSFPQFVIRECELSVIKRRIFLQHSDSSQIEDNENIVHIGRKDSTALAKRFATELENENLYLVLSHTACTDENFIAVMIQKCSLTTAQMLKLKDKHSKEDFLSLVSSNKSSNLLKYIQQKAKISLSEDDVNTILYGVCKYAATDAFVYLKKKIGLKFDITADKDKRRTPLMIAAETEDAEFVKMIMSDKHDLTVHDSNRATVLHYLSEHGLRSAVEDAINQGAAIDVKDNFGFSPLLYAVKFDEMEIVELLLNRGAKPDAKIIDAACRKCGIDVVRLVFRSEPVDKELVHGYKPLHSACAGGNVGIVNFLIDKGASVNSAFKSPLHIAASHNEPEVVKCLLEKHAKVMSKDENDETPLHYAAAAGSKKCLELLLNAGVVGAHQTDIDGKNSKGLTPLHKAAKARSKDCIQVLLHAGATANECTNECLTPLHFVSLKGAEECVQMLIKAGGSVNATDKADYTPLHEAAKGGFHQCLDTLLKNGADVNVRNEHQQTPLHKAAEIGSLECVRLLIEKMAEVNAKTKSGKTPLHYAAKSKSLECVSFLLKEAADINIQDDLGFVPLHVAAKAGSEGCIRVLLENQLVNVQTKDGETPLHLSADRSSIECVDLLLKKGANVNIQNRTRETALHKSVALVCDNCSRKLKGSHFKHIVKAVSSKPQSCVNLLIKAGADVNVQRHDGFTPLHLAAEYGLSDCLAILLVPLAHVNVQDKKGDTPLHKAIESRCKQCVSSLRNFGADDSIENKDGFTPHDVACQTGDAELEKLLETRP